jgi:MYXO-CTERM domain-containing protein
MRNDSGTVFSLLRHFVFISLILPLGATLRAGLVSPIPEPGGFSLALAGLLALAGKRRRRR